MAQIVEVPSLRLAAGVLQSLLEEFASRDGTDYGRRELSLEEKVSSLQAQLSTGHLRILYDSDTEYWDVVSAERAQELLQGE